jgi:hypothetical protein
MSRFKKALFPVLVALAVVVIGGATELGSSDRANAAGYCFLWMSDAKFMGQQRDYNSSTQDGCPSYFDVYRHPR